MERGEGFFNVFVTVSYDVIFFSSQRARLELTRRDQ